ncbi:MAG: SMC-Scp complex subunit ScpB [Rhodospirillales bacterium]|nr:SMC-Scp complex subunit ScpB [Rhodospirillales bacterium]MCB9973650.1 SMC-Scp complex subunit ScpB [Rhodospirillales bacterium]
MCGEYMTTNHKNLLEALLFAAPEPLETQALHDRMPADADVGPLLMELQKDYETRGIRLTRHNNMWAFRTTPELAEDLQLDRTELRKLSKASLETMAIIAYHQPVTRAEIENIRGVATSKGTLDVLMEAGWVKPGKRRESVGKPLTWVTTNAFLDHFGLESTMDLPGLDDMKAAGLLDRRPAIDTVPDLFQKDTASTEDSEEDEA